MDPVTLVAVLVALVLGGISGYFIAEKVTRKAGDSTIKRATAEADRIRKSAEREAELKLKSIEIEAQEAAAKKAKNAEKELSRKRQDVEKEANRLKKREDQLDRRAEQIDRREQSLSDRENNLEEKTAKLDKTLEDAETMRSELVKRCEVISGMTAEEAKKLLLEELETDLRQESAALVRRIETETEEVAEKKARQIITLAMQRISSETVTETTVSVVNLPNDDMKGRIIGREGRNIRSLEQATGVNIIVDDTPEAVVLSSFDPIRREVARIVLEKLIQDGRIHPSRIEELVEKTTKQVEAEARKAGEDACLELGIPDLHPELIKLLGRLKFRTSYGQNILRHSVECAHIAQMISAELGLDDKLAKRATLLHDIGKAVTHEVEGPHAIIGADLARKYKERQEIVHAIEAHHFEVKPKTLTAMLVITADSISAARPGARRETLESYIKRLQNLEEIATSFKGVSGAYAIQAGREIRIVVEPEELNDNECSALARDVTKRIENELQYPGQIKVVVVRELRKTEYAR